MIYIDKNTTDVLIPKVRFEEARRLVFVNQTTLAEITLEDAIDKTPFEYLYTFDISSVTEEFETGVYDYRIEGDGKILASGIAIFGDFRPEGEAYHTEITYKTYKG